MSLKQHNTVKCNTITSRRGFGASSGVD